VNVKAIPSVPLRLRTDDPPELLEVRGEIYMPPAAFRKLNEGLAEEGERVFANPATPQPAPCARRTPR